MQRKILWIVNMVLPELAKFLNITTSSSGTWMEDLSIQLSNEEENKLAIACIYGNKFQKIKINNIIYFLIPGNGKTMLFYHKNLIKYWKLIEDDFSPDIVHIHGTEYSHAISYLRNYPDKKYLLTIQGVIGKIKNKNSGELSVFTQIKNRTFSEFIHFNGMIENTILSKFNNKYEKEIISKCNFITGRTDWDKSYALKINPQIKYFRVFYNLRDEFYKTEKWNIKECNKNLIYGSTACSLPLKGGHIILKALSIVKEKIPDIKVIFIAPSKNKKLIIKNGYTKYINKLIKKFNLQDNIEFYSRLNTCEVIDKMRKSRLCVIPSAMENASATLREAMDLGVPSIASARGGMIDLIKNGVNGFLFDYEEYEYLAEKIIQLLQNDELCIKFSENSKKEASNWHNRKKNIIDMNNVYKYIMGGNEC